MNLEPKHLKGYGEVVEIKEYSIDTDGFGDMANCLTVKIGKGFNPSASIVTELMRVIDFHTDGKYKYLIHADINLNRFDYEISDTNINI